MRKVILLLFVFLAGCTRTLQTFQHTYSALPPHPSKLALQCRFEIVRAGQTLQFDSALESSPQQITFVVFSKFGPKSLVLREKDYTLFIEQSRLYNLPYSAIELSEIVHRFISAYVHSRTKGTIELLGPNGENIKIASASA